jgi:hypothetical protein
MPIYYEPGPTTLIADEWQSQQAFNAVLAVIASFDVNQNQPRFNKAVNLLFSGTSGVIAATASFNIRDESGSGKSITVCKVHISPSVAGQCHLTLHGVEIWRGVLLAAQPFVIDFGDAGYCTYGFGDVLAIVNDTAGNVTYQISVYGDTQLVQVR